ncbi:MAG: GGDEF domain-containing protein [Burkholderiaceae bacterium]
MSQLAVLAAGLNAFWVLLFAWFGSATLSILSVFSVAIYWAAYQSIKARRNKLVMILWWSEVVIHVFVATLLLGWSSAYYLYLILAVPGLQLSAPRGQAKWRLLGIILLFLALYITSSLVGPQAPIGQFETMIVASLNYLVIIGFFQSSAAAYRNTVRRAEKKLREQATTDELTGLSNRAHFQSRATTEVARARREGSSVGLLLADVDHFKRVNDRYGHEAGDTTLKEIAKILQEGLREVDILARWGGEEFLILLPGSSAVRSYEVAERLRASIAEKSFAAKANAFSATISIGTASLDDNEELDAAISRADQALYRSKSNGRNLVTASSSDEPVRQTTEAETFLASK